MALLSQTTLISLSKSNQKFFSWLLDTSIFYTDHRFQATMLAFWITNSIVFWTGETRPLDLIKIQRVSNFAESFKWIAWLGDCSRVHDRSAKHLSVCFLCMLIRTVYCWIKVLTPPCVYSAPLLQCHILGLKNISCLTLETLCDSLVTPTTAATLTGTESRSACWQEKRFTYRATSWSLQM